MQEQQMAVLKDLANPESALESLVENLETNQPIASPPPPPLDQQQLFQQHQRQQIQLQQQQNPHHHQQQRYVAGPESDSEIEICTKLTYGENSKVNECKMKLCRVATTPSFPPQYSLSLEELRRKTMSGDGTSFYIYNKHIDGYQPIFDT